MTSPLYLHIFNAFQTVIIWFKNNAKPSGEDKKTSALSKSVMRKFASRGPAPSRLWWGDNTDLVQREAGSSNVGEKSRTAALLFQNLPKHVQEAYAEKAKDLKAECKEDECFQ